MLIISGFIYSNFIENTTSLEQIDIFLKNYSDPVPELASHLRRFIKKEIPGIEEQLDIKTRVIGFGFGSGYSGMICAIILSKKGVKLGLYRGTELHDPTHLLKGSGKVHKHVELKSREEIQSPAFRDLLIQAHTAFLGRKMK